MISSILAIAVLGAVLSVFTDDLMEVYDRMTPWNLMAMIKVCPKLTIVEWEGVTPPTRPSEFINRRFKKCRNPSKYEPGQGSNHENEKR